MGSIFRVKYFSVYKMLSYLLDVCSCFSPCQQNRTEKNLWFLSLERIRSPLSPSYLNSSHQESKSNDLDFKDRSSESASTFRTLNRSVDPILPSDSFNVPYNNSIQSDRRSSRNRNSLFTEERREVIKNLENSLVLGTWFT